MSDKRIEVLATDGTRFFVQTAKEAAEVHAFIAGMRNTATKVEVVHAEPSAPSAPGVMHTVTMPEPPRSEKPFVGALCIMADAGAIESRRLTTSLGMTDGRGLASIPTNVKNTLGPAGFREEDVFTRERHADGSTWWKSGPRIREAIEEARKRLTGKRARRRRERPSMA